MALIYAQKRSFDTYEGMLEDGMVSRSDDAGGYAKDSDNFLYATGTACVQFEVRFSDSFMNNANMNSIGFYLCCVVRMVMMQTAVPPCRSAPCPSYSLSAYSTFGGQNISLSGRSRTLNYASSNRIAFDHL